MKNHLAFNLAWALCDCEKDGSINLPTGENFAPSRRTSERIISLQDSLNAILKKIRIVSQETERGFR